MRGFAITFTVLAMASAAQAQERADRQRGATLSQRYCAGCHAVGLTGDSPNPAAPPFRELHRRYSIDNLAEALAEGMLVGHPAMPEFQFQPDDVRAIVAYLKSVQTNQKVSFRRAAGS